MLIILLDSTPPSKTADNQSDHILAAVRCLSKISAQQHKASSELDTLEYDNQMLQCLKELDEPDEYNFIYDHTIRLLKPLLKFKRGYMESEISYAQELLILLWQCLENNPGFESYICYNKPIWELVEILAYVIYENRELESKTGLLQHCLFILLHLSGNREFSVKMNEPCASFMTAENHFDLLVHIFHSIILSKSHLNSLVSCMLTILTNL